MRQSKFTETQIVSMLKEADAGRPVNEIWRSYGISNTSSRAGGHSIADAVAPPNLVDGAARHRLFQHGHNLRFGEFRLAHGNLLARVTIVREDSPFGLSLSGELTTRRDAALCGASPPLCLSRPRDRRRHSRRPPAAAAHPRATL